MGYPQGGQPVYVQQRPEGGGGMGAGGGLLGESLEGFGARHREGGQR